VIELAPWRDDDLGEVAALALVEHRIFGDLGRKPHAARAHDTALGVVDDGRAEHHALGLVDRLVAHALLGALVLEPIILQAALTSLIADGAIDRVIQKQKLLHRRARLLDLARRFAFDLHVLAGRYLASGLELGLAGDDVVLFFLVPSENVELHGALSGGRRDLDQAHATVGGHAETGVPAIVRDVDAHPVRSTNDRVALFERNLTSV